MNKSNVLPYIAAALSSCIFGLSFLFTKEALKAAEPIEVVSFRFLTAFVIMTVLIKLKIMKVNYKGKPVMWLVVLSLLEPVLYFIFETYGIKHVASSVSGLMIALIPVMVTVLGAYILKEIPTLKSLFFIFISVLGVVFIVSMGNTGKGTGTSLPGIFLLFCAVTCASLFNIVSRKISKHFTAGEITYFMMFIAAVSFNAISIVKHIAYGNIYNYFSPLKSIVFVRSILYLGVVSSVAAYFLINYSLSKIRASVVSVFSNISTVVSILAGVMILGEKFYMYHIIGSVLIIAGVIGTNLTNSSAK